MPLTPQEQQMFDLLPQAFRSISEISTKYSDYWSLIEDHLKHLYGEQYSFNSHIESYLTSSVDKEREDRRFSIITPETSHIITTNQAEALIAQEKEDSDRIDKVISAYSSYQQQKLPRIPQDLILESAELFGVYNSATTGRELYPNLINEMDRNAKANGVDGNDMTYLSLIMDTLLALLLPGIQVTFPQHQTVMSQSKRKWYYRGEHAFYGSSRPSIYRRVEKKIPADYYGILNLLRINEACYFLDNFNAISQWSVSGVNYYALLQHYGVYTPLMDITSDLMTALFFACCYYGRDQKWHPLTAKDINNSQKIERMRRTGGDPRFAVLYRSPVDVTDMMWGVGYHSDGTKIITPIGYQPFMRCSSQYGYCIWAPDKTYDLYKDPMFEKTLIALDEEFCRWLFEEMGNGELIYPIHDIPDMEDHLSKFNTMRRFSERSFYHIFRNMPEYSPETLELFRADLLKVGIIIVRGEQEHLPKKKIAKINKRYSLHDAERSFDLDSTDPIIKPLLTIASKTPIKESDGETVLDI